MGSKIYQEVEWICPHCNHVNKDTFLDIETHPVECTDCKKSFDIYLKVKLDIEVLEVSDGTITEQDRLFLLRGIKRAFDAGKIDKLDALEVIGIITNLTDEKK